MMDGWLRMNCLMAFCGFMCVGVGFGTAGAVGTTGSGSGRELEEEVLSLE